MALYSLIVPMCHKKLLTHSLTEHEQSNATLQINTMMQLNSQNDI